METVPTQVESIQKRSPSFFNATQMQRAIRAREIVLKKDMAITVKAVSGEARWIAIEIIMNTAKRFISSHLLPHKRLPLEQFTAALEEFHEMLSTFPKNEVLIGIEANTKLAGQSCVRERRREREHLREPLARNGLVAHNTWRAGAAPQEDMYTRKSGTSTRSWAFLRYVFDTRDDQSKTMQNQGKHVHEHTKQCSWK